MTYGARAGQAWRDSRCAGNIAERVLNHALDKIEGTYDVFDYLDEKRTALTLWEDYLRQLKALPRIQVTHAVPLGLARAASTSGITDT